MDVRIGISDKKAAELLGVIGDGEKVNAITYFKLNNDEMITMKFSHLYKDGVGYWFGITPSAVEQYRKLLITHICLILGYEGVVKLPFKILEDYIEHADISKIVTNGNERIKHYHIRIKYDQDILLYNSVDKIIVNDYLVYDEDVILSELASKSKEQLKLEASHFKDYEQQYVESEKKSKRRKESKAQKERIAAIEDHKCQVCGFYQEYFRGKTKRWIINVDHIEDKAKGGGETIDNLWVLCPNCHAKKTYGVIKIDKQCRIVTECGNVIQIRDNHLDWS